MAKEDSAVGSRAAAGAGCTTMALVLAALQGARALQAAEGQARVAKARGRREGAALQTPWPT